VCFKKKNPSSGVYKLIKLLQMKGPVQKQTKFHFNKLLENNKTRLKIQIRA
jgi:hypothetical protein